MSNYTAMLNSTNWTSPSDLLVQANTNTGGAFWSGMYLMVIIIAFITALPFGFEVATIMALFLGMLSGIFLVYLGLVQMWMFGMTEGILLFMVIYFIYTSRSQQ